MCWTLLSILCLNVAKQHNRSWNRYACLIDISVPSRNDTVTSVYGSQSGKNGESWSSERWISVPGFSLFKPERRRRLARAITKIKQVPDKPFPGVHSRRTVPQRRSVMNNLQLRLRGKCKMWLFFIPHPRHRSLGTVVTQTDISYVVPPTPVTFFTPPTGLDVVWLAKAGREVDLIGCSFRGEGWKERRKKEVRSLAYEFTKHSNRKCCSAKPIITHVIIKNTLQKYLNPLKFTNVNVF